LGDSLISQEERTLNQPISKSSLSASQIRLVDLCHQHPFCRLGRLQVRGGEPLFTPPPTITQKLKMGADNASRPEAALPDFWLKKQMVELLEIIGEVGEGEIQTIEIVHGLPLLVEIERTVTFDEGSPDA
jgi:hypothetical protein